MIGIFGGTFDPVHYGHLRPLLEVKQALRLDEVRLVPCFIPPHRELPGASAEQRLAMLRLAVQELPEFVIDEREIERGGPSYMVDTLQSLRDEVGIEKPLCLIMGMDAFVMLDTWHQWRRLLELAHIVVTQRPGCEMELSETMAALVAECRVANPDALRDQAAGKIYVQQVTQLDISATRIRQWAAEGKDLQFLMPESVMGYIRENGLYNNIDEMFFEIEKS